MNRSEPRVIVGVSPSLAGLAALRLGAAEARRRGAYLHAVRAWYLHPTYERGTEGRRWQAKLAAEAAQVVYEAFDAAMGGVPADPPVSVIVAGERVDLALTRIAGRPGDLLVLGGRTGSRRVSWIVRSCLRRARCPVITVPPPELAGTAGRRSSLQSLIRDVERFTAQAS